MERKVVEERAYTQPAVFLPSRPGQLERPAAARKSDLPLSRFPLRGKAGAGGFPPRRCAAPPARGVSKRSAETPLAHPPDGHHWGCSQIVNLDLPDRVGEKIKDGRHVGLDFYDLLIEARNTGVIRTEATCTTWRLHVNLNSQTVRR